MTLRPEKYTYNYYCPKPRSMQNKQEDNVEPLPSIRKPTIEQEAESAVNDLLKPYR